MAAKSQLHVNVVDAAGKALVADKVTFSLGASTLAATKAPFVFDLASAGKASIEVAIAKHHTFHFDLTVVQGKAANDFTVSIDTKAMLDAPRMLTLVKLAASGKGKNPGRNQMTIAIGKPREVLLVTGFDYPSSHGPGGMQFHLAGTRRMHELRKAKRLDDSTVVTWFDSKSGLRTRWVMGRGSEAIGTATSMWKSGWCRLSVDGTPPSTLNPKAPNYPGDHVNGMPEIYAHVISIGTLRPGSLEEFSVMSHSWHGGPILFNTGEQPAFDSGAQSDERDPKDRDGRFWKDFNLKNMPTRAIFTKAFSATPFIRIWGCLATHSFMNVIQTARQAKDDKVALGIAVEDRTLWFDGTTVFDDTRPGIIQYIKQSLLKANYMAFLARLTKHTVEGGAPGMGALFSPLDPFGFQLFVARADVKTKDKNGKDATIRGFKKEMEFLETKVGVTFSADGYLQYSP